MTHRRRVPCQTPSSPEYALCVSFGKKPDLASGTEVDFDQIYQVGIKPAVEDVGFETLRGDEERTGGIIHSAMFARLLLAEFVVADLTLANPQRLLRARHPPRRQAVHDCAHLRQRGRAAVHVGLVRAIPYEIKEGRLTEEGAKKLRAALETASGISAIIITGRGRLPAVARLILDVSGAGLTLSGQRIECLFEPVF